MKSRTTIQVLAIIGLLLVVTSCTTNKKYGCPNHLFTPTLVR